MEILANVSGKFDGRSVNNLETAFEFVISNFVARLLLESLGFGIFIIDFCRSNLCYGVCGIK